MSEVQIKQMQELLKKSLIKIKQLEQEIESRQSLIKNEIISSEIPKNTDVAVVGYAFRFANGIDTLQKFWNLLYEKKDAVSKIPIARFDVDEIYSEDQYEAGKTNTKFGTFLEQDIALFDTDFFGIPPREAKSIDPIQRILLELTYEAFENAGIPSNQLKTKNVGVFVAVGLSDYAQARLRSGNLEDIDVYDATGIPFATICGRISYSFDFVGQSISVDTACSSVLVAIHQAQQALNNGEIDVAVIASANLLLTPEIFVALTKMGSVSPSGKTKAFDENADGYVRGEGASVLVLKRREDAENNNDNIEIIIKSAAVKHNGTSNGFTAPNPQVQVDTIKTALSNANLSVDSIDYVEVHGIGNRYTDAMEVQAIHQAYKNRQRPIQVGSVKSNIGHLEACTGMPMLFKIIAAMQNKIIPAQIHLHELNKDVDWQKIKVNITKENTDWLKFDGSKRLAAINLSGYSGTNTHLILEEADIKQKSEEVNAPFIFNLSAKTPDALKDVVIKYLADTSVFDKHTLSEICYTLQQRNLFEHRLSIFAKDKNDIIQALQDFIDSKQNPNLFTSKNIDNNGQIVFQFTGQGSQYFGMCRNYYKSFEYFKNTIDFCDEELKQYLGESIKNVMWKHEDKHLIHQTKYTQPAIFIVEYALAQLLMKYGIQPTMLVGHSIGELVALTISGVLEIKDALKIVSMRGNLMQNIPDNNGGMAAVFANAQTIVDLNNDNIVEIAGYNTTNNTTITGDKEQIAIFIERLKEQNIRAVPLQVSHAFHSKDMESIFVDFQNICNEINFSFAQIPLASNIDGKILDKQSIDSFYLTQQLRVPVDYLKSIQNIQNTIEAEFYIECGANPVLSTLGKNILSDKNISWLYTTKPQTDDVQQFYNILQTLFSNGFNIDWSLLYIGKRINRVKLPTYAWQWKSYWYNPNRIGDVEPKLRNQDNKSIKQESIAKPKYASKNIVQPQVKRETLLVIMQIEAAKILGLEAGESLDIQKPYREQGFDSMMSGEFLAKLESLIGNGEIKMDVIHNYPTPKELHQYLIDTYFGGGAVNTNEAISMADLMFGSDISREEAGDWHTEKADDSKLLRWFKRLDNKLPKAK